MNALETGFWPHGRELDHRLRLVGRKLGLGELPRNDLAELHRENASLSNLPDGVLALTAMG